MSIDFTQLLRGTQNIGDSFQEGIDSATKMQNQQRQVAAQQLAQQNAAAARTGIAAALQTGDYNRAASVAAQFGDDKSATVLASIGKTKYDQGGKNTTSMANIVGSISALPYAQRAGAIQAAKPLLVAQGLDPQAIDSFDPTDDNIQGLSRVDYSHSDQVKDAISQQGADTNQYNADTNRITANNPVVVGDSLVKRQDGSLLYRDPKTITADPKDNVIQLPGTSGAAPLSQDAAFANMVRAEGGTNRDGSFRTSPAGAVGPAQVMPSTGPEAAKLAGLPWDAKRYASDPQYNLALGQAYHASLVQRFGGDVPKSVAAYNAGPARVDRAVAMASKAGDPTAWANYLPAETKAYLQKVTGGTDRTVAAPVVLQHGQDPSTSDANDPAIELAARQYAITGDMPPLGNGAGPMRRAILNRAAAIVQQNNWSPTQIAQNKADYKASTAALQQGQKQYDTVQSAEQTALANGQRFVDLSAQAPGNTWSPLYNGFRNAIGQATGDTTVTNMNAAYQTFITEYAKVISATPSGAGQLSDSARHEAMDTLQNSAGVDAKRKAFEVLKLDMEARRTAQQRTIDNRQNHIAHLGDAHAAPSNVPPAAAQYLRAHPETRGHFDRTFGAGASASVLGS